MTLYSDWECMGLNVGCEPRLNASAMQWSPTEADVLCIGTVDGALLVLRVACDQRTDAISRCSLSLIAALRLSTGSHAVSSLSWSPKGTSASTVADRRF